MNTKHSFLFPSSTFTRSEAQFRSTTIPSSLSYSIRFFQLPISSSKFPSSSPHFRLTKTAICPLAIAATLPTQKFASEKIPDWSSRAIRSFALGELEARRLRYPNTGTEALLLGILFEGTNSVAQFLRANGVTLFKVRDEAMNLLGKSECLYNSPEHPSLTEQAQRAIDRAIEEKLRLGDDGEITTTHIFLGIWSEEDSAARNILDKLGFNDEKAQEFLNSAN